MSTASKKTAGARTAQRAIRVASVPASHVYVRHLSAVHGSDGVVRLPDPPPADGRTVPGGWWPPLMLDPRWIREHHQSFDVFHIHFGFDTVDSTALSRIVEELRAHRKPLIYTVHDLRNPHQPDAASHRTQLDVLIPSADALITLTPGAARQIAKTWGRHAHVLAHPHVVEREYVEAPRPPTAQFVVGVHLKSLRPNMDPFPVLNQLTETIAALPGAVLRINLHDEIFDPGNHWYNPATGASLRSYARQRDTAVNVHKYFSDDQLWQYLSSLSVSVLPYRFGTHSGWLEACHDLGTAVVAPSCGYYGQQRECNVFDFSETHFDPGSLDRAVRESYWSRAPRARWKARLRERHQLAAAHQQIYAQVLG